MKLLTITALVTAVLTACGTNAPKISEKEIQAKRIESLSVYNDNRVAFKVTYKQGGTAWAWTEDSGQILALLIGEKIYNSKDILSITSKPLKDSINYSVTVHLKNGETVVSQTTSSYNRGKEEYSGPYWVGCDKNKICNRWAQINKLDYAKLVDNFRSIQETDLTKTKTTRPIESDISKGEFAGLSAGTFVELEIIDDSERKKINDRIAVTNKARTDYYQTIINDNIKNEQAILAEAEKMRRTVRVGTQTNCGQVFAVNIPMVGVQTIVGMQYIDLEKLYGPSASCKFINGVYVGRNQSK